jgi:hypothetical protein
MMGAPSRTDDTQPGQSERRKEPGGENPAPSAEGNAMPLTDSVGEQPDDRVNVASSGCDDEKPEGESVSLKVGAEPTTLEQSEWEGGEQNKFGTTIEAGQGDFQKPPVDTTNEMVPSFIRPEEVNPTELTDQTPASDSKQTKEKSRDRGITTDENQLKITNLIVSGIKWLQKNLAVGRYPNMVEELEWVIKNPAHALSHIYELRDRQHMLSYEVADLKQVNNRLKSTLDEMRYANSKIAERLSDIQYLQQSNAELRQALKTHESESREVKQRYAELDDRANKLISELASARRNRAATYVADSGTQNHLLIQEFKVLRDQDVHEVSSEIYRHLSARDTSLKSLRKAEIARIKSTLSKEILIKGRKALIDMGGQPNESIATAVGQVMTSILKSLGGADEFPSTLHSSVRELAAKGLELVRRIKAADPPGELWMDEHGEPFDPQIHEPTPDCERGGRIDFTVYPSYIVNHRVFEKALVRTYLE